MTTKILRSSASAMRHRVRLFRWNVDESLVFTSEPFAKLEALHTRGGIK